MTSTIGIDYGSIQFDVEEEIVSVDLFDSSGLDQFAEIRNEFYQNTDAFLLVFDVSNQQSFDRLQFWINEIKNRLMQEDWKQRIYVVGNKNDVVGRKVSPQQGMGFVEKHNLSNYFDTSALTGSYIDAMFEKVFEEASRS
jgi:small GTP-binding protein